MVKNRIIDETNGLWYELDGEHYIPCLTLSEETSHPIGVWGLRHKRCIKQHRSGLYNELLLSGKLNSYLADINAQAEEMFSLLVEQMAQKQGITEELKAGDQMAWVGRMNNIYHAAREIVNGEFIFV